jgi:hypothetical protein
MSKILRLCSLCLVFSVVSAIAQSSPTPRASDPQAIALATSALVALTKGTQIRDVTLVGTATRTAGSDVESGTVTLKALGQQNGRIDLNLSDGTRSEIISAPNGNPQGFWTAPDGAIHNMANHNCVTDAAWFFPGLTVLSQVSNPRILATYVGEETRGDRGVQHLRFVEQFPSLAEHVNGLLSSLTAEDVYLDSSSLLPTAIRFNTHPDNDATTNIPVEIDFSDYQSVSGAAMPFKIQKFLNGALFLDITIQSATLNSGLSDSAFAVQ